MGLGCQGSQSLSCPSEPCVAIREPRRLAASPRIKDSERYWGRLVWAGMLATSWWHMYKSRPHSQCRNRSGHFNNVAIAARHAQIVYPSVKKVMIVDFDVHHGNGTQEIFWSDPTVMYCSTHEMPLYPGTGAIGERGEHDTIVNAPLSAGDGGEAFREAFETVILPRLRDFKPEFLIISAGFDAHTRDPLANLNLVEADYAWVTKKLMDIADKSAQGRVVSVLEGGYDLQGLSRSVAAHISALMGH